MVLAAGAGRRLRPDTDMLPKALLPVDGQVTILDIALRNLAAVGLRDIVIVVGYAADAIRDRVADLERDHKVGLTLVDNDRAQEWNNAYSLWLAREHFAAGALLVNGDTVHPVSVEKTLLSAAGAGTGRAGLILGGGGARELDCSGGAGESGRCDVAALWGVAGYESCVGRYAEPVKQPGDPADKRRDAGDDCGHKCGECARAGNDQSAAE